MTLTLIEKLQQTPLSLLGAEQLLVEKSYPQSAYDVWHGTIIDKTTTPPSQYEGSWSIHKHKTEDLYAATIHQDNIFQGAYLVDISNLF